MCYSPWGHIESDTTEQLNGTERKCFGKLLFLFYFIFKIFHIWRTIIDWVVSPKRYVQVLTLRACKCDFSWKKDLGKCDQFKMRSLEWHYPVWLMSLWEEGRHREKHTERSTQREVMLEAEIGITMPRVNGCLELPDDKRSKKGSSFGGARGSMALPKPWFRTSSLQNRERKHFHYFKPPHLGGFVIAALEN